MKKAMTVLGIFISSVPLFLIITDMSHTKQFGSCRLGGIQNRRIPEMNQVTGDWRLIPHQSMERGLR